MTKLERAAIAYVSARLERLESSRQERFRDHCYAPFGEKCVKDHDCTMLRSQQARHDMRVDDVVKSWNALRDLVALELASGVTNETLVEYDRSGRND